MKTWAQTPHWALVFGEISKHEIGENEVNAKPPACARELENWARTGSETQKDNW